MMPGGGFGQQQGGIGGQQSQGTMPNTWAPTKGMASAKQPEFYQSISCLQGKPDTWI